MSTVESIVSTITMAIPVATFGALFVSVFLFVRYKGTKDALVDAANTWKELAEARGATLEETERTLKELEGEIDRLEGDAAACKRAMALAIDELIAGFERARSDESHV